MSEQSKAELEKTIQGRAIEYGAKDIEPEQNGEILEWPADEERVSLSRITYDKKTDTFCGWSDAKSTPVWEQK